MSDPEAEITIQRLTAEISRLNAEIAGYKLLLTVPDEPDDRRASLREVQILELLAQGLTKDEIAEEIGLTLNTVKTHVYRVTRRWGARNTTHMVVIAKDEGII
jgi:DNA-binding NarL/FixJ family response regulator